MKYLFSVSNLRTDDTRLFSVEAESEEIAKINFVSKSFPLMPDIDLDTLSNELASSMDVVISYLGSDSQIKEL